MRSLQCALLCVAVAACGGGDDDGAAPDGGAINSDAAAAPPEIMTLSPDHGPLAGGTTVTLTGANFTGADMVVFGTLQAMGVTTVDATTLEVVAPAGLADGPVDVTVFNSGGFAMATGAYSYNPLPTIASISPQHGDPGATVTITGTGFTALEAGANTVMVGDAACGSIATASDTEITCVPALGAPYEYRTVTVTNANGTATADPGFRHVGSGLLIAEGRNAAGTPKLYYFDPTTMALAEIGPTIDMTGLATAPDGTVYGATSNRSNRQLVTVDPRTGAYAVIGPIRIDGSTNEPRIGDITWHDDTLYGWLARDGEDLFTIDLATGAGTTVGDSAIGTNYRAIASDGTDVFIAQHTSANARLVDVSNGSVTPAFGITEASSDNIRTMTWYDGELYAVRRGIAAPEPPKAWAVPGGGSSGATIVHIDVETGAVTPLVVVPFDAHAIGVTPF